MTFFPRFNLVVVAGGLVAGVVSFVVGVYMGVLGFDIWPFRCTADGYSEDSYLSYCTDRAYGDFEIGGIALGIDPQVAKNIKNADVLFLGASRAKFAFSSPVIDAYFENKGVPYYIMAFAGEADVLPRRLIVENDLKPALIVVNVDYFFYDSANIVAKKLAAGKMAAAVEYSAKYAMQPYHEAYCGKNSDPNSLLHRFCGTKAAQYRSRRTGASQYLNWPLDKKQVIEYGAFPETIFPVIEKGARKFKAVADAQGACLALTFVPTSNLTPEVARRVARELNLPFIETSPEGLYTFDGSHMRPKSADVWASRFVPKFDAVLNDCMSRR